MIIHDIIHVREMPAYIIRVDPRICRQAGYFGWVNSIFKNYFHINDTHIKKIIRKF